MVKPLSRLVSMSVIAGVQFHLESSTEVLETLNGNKKSTCNRKDEMYRWAAMFVAV